MSDKHPASASADAPVAFPAKSARPFPVPRAAGSAVSATSALGASGPVDSLDGTLMATLRMELQERSAEHTVVRMPVDGARQVTGVLHGGANAALVETAASVAAREAAPTGTAPVGTDLQVSHLRPARRGWVTAVATPLHRGRRTTVYRVEVSDEDGHVVAHGTLRCLYVEVDGF
ncbi:MULTISPECIES: PaaI family thioesterase [unclassified Actinomyces]|uniref:PaaI family thioesterase n=1 Tax=unclassified Actinomyces TaxID=2609248 RepID=UPI0013A6A2EE|nr:MULTISPECIES: PaaI family thioesterase [unclassified Actinomyces]MBW3068993.1 PaaI family thioesterase [Actinomyces sp. 594]NDR54056.1 PaaI family thioesterase [Actinomyces sp. 565]